MNRRQFRVAAALGFALLLGSCSSRLGWGVVLWTAPDGPLPAGSIVPVYIKSNIEQTYVVGVPGAKNKKIELPLWQVELYPSRGKAAARVKALGENVSLYMAATRDGLPLRDKPTNSGKRVYRLREGQSVKILAKAVDGEILNTGGQALPGSWYQVLTDDGVIGFAYSYAYRIYDEAKEGPPVLASAKQALSGRVDLVFSRSWRPEYFQEMIDDNRIDLDYFSLRYGLFVDGIRRQIRLELPGASQIFNYTAISETERLYVFDGTPLKIKIENDSRMLCTWTDAAPEHTVLSSPDSGDEQPGEAQAGEPQTAQPETAETQASTESPNRTGAGGSAALVVLSADPGETIRLETLRRLKLLTAFVDEVGGSWSSADAGKLVLSKNGRFAWTGRGEALASTLPEGAGEKGDVAFRDFLDPSLASAWNGSFSLRFDSASPEAPRLKWNDFLYRQTPAGLVIEPAISSGLLVQAPDSRTGPLVLEKAVE
jgi:hypothetical protein